MHWLAIMASELPVQQSLQKVRKGDQSMGVAYARTLSCGKKVQGSHPSSSSLSCKCPRLCQRQGRVAFFDATLPCFWHSLGQQGGRKKALPTVNAKSWQNPPGGNPAVIAEGEKEIRAWEWPMQEHHHVARKSTDLECGKSCSGYS